VTAISAACLPTPALVSADSGAPAIPGAWHVAPVRMKVRAASSLARIGILVAPEPMQPARGRE
jgi:hypothetical protein